MGTLMGRECARRISGGPAGEILLPVSPLRPIPAYFGWRLGRAGAVLRGRIMEAPAKWCVDTTLVKIDGGHVRMTAWGYVCP